MSMRISIGACRRVLSIMSWTEVGGIPLTVEGEERVITQVVAREGHWYSGEDRLTRRQQEELTERAQAIIEDDLKRYQERFPRLPPRISIRECQEAIGIAGGIPMMLRGEERRITEVRTRGGGNTRWFSGGLRMTVSEQVKLTQLARAIIERHRKG
jgi:hypothetical protein